MTLTLERGPTPPQSSAVRAPASVAGGSAGGGPLVLVVGSGKGGVGKSVLTILLGLIASRAGRRVLLCDADYNLANLHVLLGTPPTSQLDELLAGSIPASAILRSITERLWILPGASGGELLQTLEPLDRARLHARLTSAFAGFDVVLVDAGAGVDGVLRATAMGAGRLVLVTSPEPPALTDAYAVLKLVHLRTPSLPVDVLVNQCQGDGEGRIAYDKLAIAVERFLRKGVRFLGAVGDDSTIRAAVREPGSCLAILERSDTLRRLTPCIVDQMALPMTARSVG